MQTKNVNVQPSVSKNEKNAAAAAKNAASQNGSAVNGSLLNGQANNGPLLNSQSTTGPLLNGQSANGTQMSGTEMTSNNKRPGHNAALSVSTLNGMNSNMNGSVSSADTNMQPQPSTSSPYQTLPSNSSIYLPMKSPYMHLPVTSGHQHPQTSPYQQLPVTSAATSPYQPPPLPPRLGGQRQKDMLTVAHAAPAAGTVHSVYKPVPPPKPFSGTAPLAAGGSTAEEQDNGAQQGSATTLRDQLAAITGVPVSGGVVNGPPPLLSHILVTDQGHFHTHSTKFPIEVKEGPASIPYGASAPVPVTSCWSSTLGRGLRGLSGLAGMGLAKGSTLPRTGVPSLASSSTITVTHHHLHPTGGGGTGGVGVEEKEQLVNSERHIRFLDGIDNPGLLDDTHMVAKLPSTRGVNHAQPSLIPPEGTLAGVLPSAQPRPYESPFLQRPQYRTATHQQQHSSSQPNPVTSQQYSASSQSHSVTCQPHPATSHPHLSSSQSFSATSQQASFTRETWMRTSQEQYTGPVEIHPPQGHLYMNGHSSHPHHGLPTSHIINGSSHSHPTTQLESSHSHHAHHSGHHSLINSHQEQAAGHSNGPSHTTDDNAANKSQEQCDDPRKDEKWGSLTRGLAARKYQHFKEKLSNKFSRDKGDERPGESKNTASQGTNTQNTSNENNNSSSSQQQHEGGIESGPGRESGRVNKLNTSFRRAVQQIPGHQTTMETSLTHDHGLISGLPPQYPRNQDQHHSKHVLTASPPQPTGASSPHINRSQQQQQDPLGRGLSNRRSGSYHHLAQVRQEPPLSWHPHHYSVDNLAHTHALPSDHTYSGPAVTSGRGQPAGGEGGGSGGSDSGRGTAGSGGEGRIPNALDTSLDSTASHKHNNHSHSSGNDSEWVDLTDAELQLIMKKGGEGKARGEGGSGGGGKLVRRESLAATPPLPPLSPEGTPQPSPQPTPPRHRKYSLSYSCNGLNKPDLLEAAGSKRTGGGIGGGGGTGSGSCDGGGGGNAQNSSQSTPRRSTAPQPQHSHVGKNCGGHRSQAATAPNWHHRKEEERQRGAVAYDTHTKSKTRINIDAALCELDAGEITSTTDALDLDSMLDGATEATTDDDEASHPDVHLIRKQLEGLEGMYSEVLKLLGGGRRGVRHLHGVGGLAGGDLKASRRRLHGSLSSLPSSIMSSRPGRDKRRVIDDRVRKIGKDGGSRTIHKRFQRLESHVVTLARSVAHLSSEMRTQHLMFQEIESVRAEVAALRTGGGGGGSGGGHSGRTGGHVSWESFRAGIPGLSNPGRVKKLTQFFGDEPPLVRIFLRKLGYEKYAALFEQEKIGMLELPYLTEERLQKIGIPMGPRLRILQEAQGPIRKEGNLSVYVV